jgi:hypothetical protein
MSSVRVFNLIGMGVVGLTFQSDHIVGVWLEPILGCPVSPPIVFANLTFIIPASPSISSFVQSYIKSDTSMTKSRV